MNKRPPPRWYRYKRCDSRSINRWENFLTVTTLNRSYANYVSICFSVSATGAQEPVVTRNYIITFYDSIGTHYICPISRTDRNVITSTRDDVYDACGHMLQSSPVWKCYDFSRNNEKCAICCVFCMMIWWMDGSYLTADSVTSVLYGNASNQDGKALQRVVHLAEHISGSTLPSLQDIYLKRCKSRAAKIIKDSNHPSNRLFFLLPSGKRFRSMMAKTERLRKSFFPQAIRLLNSNSF